ncbi:AAC(3) family N-acetyltransferase [Candidatus Kaiserbacteria bacterium]|nr:AAC(3) family N-acetyltransferase [Candidatus Kaiserbacteria bacterium]
MADDLEIKIGIEATGYTLERVESIDPRWIKKLRQLIKNGTCEFIGSGYAQIIGPLVPADVSKKNLEYGDEIYKRLLGIKPEIAYVNEQTYAQGLVSIYLEAGYKAMIAEWNNAFRFHPNWEKTWQYYPQFAIDQENTKIALMWNNTTAFQKFQSYVHGELGLKEYAEYLSSHIGKADRFLPVYGSDVEVFDFRADRYANEVALKEKAEWKRIRLFFKTISKDPAFSLVLPSKVLTLAKSKDTFNDLRLEAPEQPIVVKKQEKYNVTRWALTGVNDLSINTKCFQIYNSLKEIEADPVLSENVAELQRKMGDVFWKELCFLWSSDFRTHIEQRKFEAFLSRLDRLLEVTSTIAHKKKGASVTQEKTKPKVFPKAKVHNDTKLLIVETSGLKVILDKEKGLSIDSLVLKDLSENPVIKTLSKGYYGDISLEEDFYCGHTDIKIPGHKEVSDLGKVAVLISGNNVASADSVKIEADIKVDFGTIRKHVVIYKNEPRIDITYDFELKDLPPASFRTGIMTFNPEAFDLKTLFYRSSNGGKGADRFDLGDSDAISAGPISLLVSARSALGNTDGVLEIGDRYKSIVIRTDMAQLAALPMLHFVPLEATFLLRTLFSLAETDDTSFVLRPKHTSFKRRFSLSISPKKVADGNFLTRKRRSNLPLYQTADGSISYSDLARTIRHVGIKKGDVVFVHSDVSVFGKIVEKDRDVFFGSLVDLLKEAVGKGGTIIMPTFTYSMTEGKVFDVSNSPSTVGALTEYFRQLPDVVRTVEPILSVAIWGKHKKYLSAIGNSSYDKNSIFDNFHKLRGKMLFFGSRACTFLHHVECMHGVPYRFNKRFKGKIRNQGKIYEAEFMYYARRLDRRNTSYFSIAEADMIKKGLLKKVPVGHSAIASVGSDALFKEVSKNLDRDSEYYLKSYLTEFEDNKLT